MFWSRWVLESLDGGRSKSKSGLQGWVKLIQFKFSIITYIIWFGDWCIDFYSVWSRRTFLILHYWEVLPRPEAFLRFHIRLRRFLLRSIKIFQSIRLLILLRKKKNCSLQFWSIQLIYFVKKHYLKICKVEEIFSKFTYWLITESRLEFRWYTVKIT